MDFDIICFDCDSTLSEIEGIDELAKRAGCGAEMAELTHAAMNGEVSLASVYAQRLALIKPNRQAIVWLAQLYIERLVPGVRQVFNTLQAAGKDIHIISGGLRPAILPLSAYLNIDAAHVHAVELKFNTQGDYIAFNQQSPLTRNGGKAEICRTLNPRQANLVMIGDGNTDMEAKQAGAFCIGFGGVVSRDTVRAQADVFFDAHDLRAVLVLLGVDER